MVEPIASNVADQEPKIKRFRPFSQQDKIEQIRKVIGEFNPSPEILRLFNVESCVVTGFDLIYREPIGANPDMELALNDSEYLNRPSYQVCYYFNVGTKPYTRDHTTVTEKDYSAFDPHVVKDLTSVNKTSQMYLYEDESQTLEDVMESLRHDFNAHVWQHVFYFVQQQFYNLLDYNALYYHIRKELNVSDGELLTSSKIAAIYDTAFKYIDTLIAGWMKPELLEAANVSSFKPIVLESNFKQFSGALQHKFKTILSLVTTETNTRVVTSGLLLNDSYYPEGHIEIFDNPFNERLVAIYLRCLNMAWTTYWECVFRETFELERYAGDFL